jgi:hypothetical protein
MTPGSLRILIVFVCSTLPAFGQLEDADGPTQARCKQYLGTPLPAEAAKFSAPSSWPACHSYKLYSGIGTKIDYAAARKCAWYERLAQQANLEPKYTISSVFGGLAMLTVLYANREGADQTIELAQRFACEAGGASAEIHLRLDHIAALTKLNDPRKTKFDFCDDITSGFMKGFCAAYGSEFRDQKRIELLHQIASRFTTEQQRLFQSLRKAQKFMQRLMHAAKSPEWHDESDVSNRFAGYSPG